MMGSSGEPGQAPLALEATPFEEAKGWRRGQHLIDALPYVDALTPEEKRAVDRLIEEEMRLSAKSPADYLKELPPLPQASFEGHQLLSAEYERVASGESMPPLDVQRFRLEPPPANRRTDAAAWHLALNNARSQLEHQYNRLLNLELLLKFGPNAWRAHNESLEAATKRLQRELTDMRGAVEALNKERKLQQVQVGGQLSRLEGEWKAACLKNAEIEGACNALEAEVGRLRRQAEVAGVALPQMNGDAQHANGAAEQSGEAVERVEEAAERMDEDT